MLFKQNPFFALAIAIVTAAAAAAAILRTLTSKASPFLLNLFIKRLLMLTTVKALRCIKCINNKIISKSNRNCYNCDTSVIRYLRCAKSNYSNCTAAFAAANTAFDNFVSAKNNNAIQRVRRSLRDAIRQQLALNAAFLKGAANSTSGLASRSKGFKSSPDSFASFAFAFKTFNLNIAFIKLNSLIAANRGPVIRSASTLALALAVFIASVAFAALVAFIIVALFTLVIALAALAAALAVAITLIKR
ncbi:hypothetical protein MBM_09754 [Drepanopeziza brunnea f. sp. 'multigermtubi' MB_m1]|uniref:Uncharacterized protein n=1 Tax=Marssonina brunnea f. sp. multigermtubi (strain MB_m1) TaxID=1072389 RepID=K1WIX3_MARBU|nr:uncharacterized protein MBM_09754 [Drepanopeziza brunnea f. sp. 'multigermtubi' MB_m1]EKD12117.1 hypothetical protein MBM_09754 [Drepanopeziza brunnea f. sp. 'multigermtubi' MB_m1]